MVTEPWNFDAFLLACLDYRCAGWNACCSPVDRDIHHIWCCGCVRMSDRAQMWGYAEQGTQGTHFQFVSWRYGYGVGSERCTQQGLRNSLRLISIRSKIRAAFSVQYAQNKQIC